MSNKTSDPLEKERFERIAYTCQNVPFNPAKSLLEAFQTIWFIHLIESTVIGGRDFSFGRMDEYLYDIYKTDKEATRKSAEELFEELYIHVMEASGFSVATYGMKRITNVGSIQYIVLGGTDSNGNDVCNDLTFAALQANKELRTKEPALILRWHPLINRELFHFAVEMCSSGDGYPAFFNEKNVMKALKDFGGVSELDLNSFAFYGCDNVVLPGLSDELREVWHNFPLYLELAINNGRDFLTDRLIGEPVSIEIKTYQDLMAALRKQIRFFLMKARLHIINFDQIWPVIAPFTFESLISSDGIKNADTLSRNGSRYKHYTNHLCGIATIANSIYSIRRLVFQEKRFSLDELVTILKNDRKGYEILHKEVVDSFEKYGNNEAEVDEIAAEVSNTFFDEIKQLSDLPSGRKPYPSIYTMSHHRNLGKVVGASADGRRAKAPISESLSGTYGTEKKGPLGSLSSAAKLPINVTASGGNNIKLSPSMVKGEDGIQRLIALIKTYFEQNGTQLQINVVDNKTLEDAIQHPEKHRNLLVRVIGYSAHFVLLAPEQQREIIQRNSL